jgi:hypothetical protein
VPKHGIRQLAFVQQAGQSPSYTFAHIDRSRLDFYEELRPAIDQSDALRRAQRRCGENRTRRQSMQATDFTGFSVHKSVNPV